MSFIYNPNIPNPPDDPADDVGTMQTNAMAISNIIAVDHVGFNTVNAGYHNQVRFASNQGAPTLGLGVGGLTANNPVAQSWPVWQNANGITYQMLGANANADAATASFAAFGAYGTVTAPYTQTAGWTYLPGGMILQYASVTYTQIVSPGLIAVGFPVTYTTTNIVVTITPICKTPSTSSSTTASLLSGSVATTGFTCNFPSTSAYFGFTWMAIGV